MKYLLDSAQMKTCDNATITMHGIPSLVLMERAAMSVVDEIASRFTVEDSIGVICGTGNNGGDGVAIARLLHLQGFDVVIHMVGPSDKYSEQLKDEINIAKSYDVPFSEDISELEELDCLVDAIFGIGLTRDVTGEFAKAIEFINDSPAYVVAVDIPSGFSADSGNLLGVGVSADLTITFAYAKKGLLLSDCALNVGEILVADVGIYLSKEPDGIHTYGLEETDLMLIPARPANANKGTCGKVLVIAGSESIYGACYLSAKSAMVTGSGLVKIYTHANNISSIQAALPEAMYASYEKYNEAELRELLSWPDSIIIGPGLGTSDTSKSILKFVLENATVPMVIDADGLNILSEDISLLDKTKATVILTPHLKEMERLCGQKVSVINKSMEAISFDFVKCHKAILVLKNYVTVITTDENTNYINTSGCEALATAGSGDVLAGIIGSLLGAGIDANIAAPLGAYIHGLAGENASYEKGVTGVLASDIIDGICQVM